MSKPWSELVRTMENHGRPVAPSALHSAIASATTWLGFFAEVEQVARWAWPKRRADCSDWGALGDLLAEAKHFGVHPLMEKKDDS